ncbi:hypothetical protein VE03_06076 [Pseudogymnoascus sp. 23342-1-I1]|nr:hypothetical protein VE03_06076 [Pseudogymnoascus sp. 23342-1-I1]
MTQTPMKAGYLFLPNTQELRDLLEEITKLPIVMKWAESKRAGFGMDDTTINNKFKFKEMMEMMEVLEKLDYLTDEYCRKGLPLPTDRFPTTRFPIESDGPGARDLFSINVETWHRAFHALKQTWREDSKSRKDMKGEKSRGQSREAVVPYFLQEEDFRLFKQVGPSESTDVNPEIPDIPLSLFSASAMILLSTSGKSVAAMHLTLSNQCLVGLMQNGPIKYYL